MRSGSASLTVIAQSFQVWWDDWVNLTIQNLICLLCWLTIILGPPATFGLYFVTNRLAHGESKDLRGLVEGGRRYFLISWLWMLINLLVAIIISFNYFYYASLETLWADYLQAFFIILGVIWLVIQFYALPYLMEQEKKHLGIALRNGLFTTLAAPGYTFVVAGVGVLVVTLSIVLIFPFFLGFPCLIILLGNRAVIERLATYQVREGDEPEKKPNLKES